jgi:RimJ/RimL family protein N-acetyltransferase
MPYPERIETQRLTLRRWTGADLAAMEAIWADAAVQESLRPHMATDPLATARESLERRLGQWDEHGFGLWAAEERETDVVIGWLGAWPQDIAPSLQGEIEVGWTLRREWWGRGLAAEGARASAETAFANLPIDRVISLIHHANERSIAVATRLGMTLDGHARHAELPDLLLSVYSLPRSSSSSSSSLGASPQSFSSR